jgi:hypothetical protein
MKQRGSLGILALLFIIIGTAIILENYSLITGAIKLWPLLPLTIGAGFMMLFFERRRDPAILWIGSFLIQLAILSYCLNCFSWSKLSALWPIFLGIIGLSFLVTHIFVKNVIFLYLSILFIALFLTFYFIFAVSLKMWPISLVVFGISLLVINFNLRGKIKKKSSNSYFSHKKWRKI